MALPCGIKSPTVLPKHIGWVALPEGAVGSGFTVIINISVAPTQLFADTAATTTEA
jgi:hypothetical protein